MRFNPEDQTLGGPRCRNCHRGSSGCGGCHNTDGGVNPSTMLDPLTMDQARTVSSDNSRTDIFSFFMTVMENFNQVPAGSGAAYKAYTTYNLMQTSDGQANQISQSIPGSDMSKLLTGQVKKSRTVDWDSFDWRNMTGKVSQGDIDGMCSDDGLSWPHRTLGWKMLKDDLFGIDVGGSSITIGVGETRSFGGLNAKTHDIDSVCLDCHNPTIWNDGQIQSKDGHVDEFVDTNGDRFDENNADNANDDLLGRGLP